MISPPLVSRYLKYTSPIPTVSRCVIKRLFVTYNFFCFGGLYALSCKKAK